MRAKARMVYIKNLLFQSLSLNRSHSPSLFLGPSAVKLIKAGMERMCPSNISNKSVKNA